MDMPPAPLPPEATPPSLPPPTSDDKLWMIFCHLSIFIGLGLIVPLIVYLVKKTDSPAVAAQAREALNFHISLFLYILASIALMFILIGFVLLPILIIIAVVFPIIAAIKSSEGVLYRYPLTIRFVK